MVGAVFLLEGLLKLLQPALRGPGRFEKMGFPKLELFGYFVGGFETLCGALVLVGLGTRLVTFSLVAIRCS